MSVKLYVGNLDWAVTSQQLGEMFSQAGNVASATVITDKFSKRSKGFGFVEFEDEASANKAIDMFNGKDMSGRAIVVNPARPQEPRQ